MSSVTPCATASTVYDLSVERDHNYLVGDRAVVAHNCCTLAQQNALLRVILDRQVGEYTLPPGVHVVCAANPPDTSAGGWELSAAFANRLAHLKWPVPTISEWAAWLIRQPVVGKDVEWSMFSRRLLVSFLSAQPGLLLQLPPDDAERGRAWPSPRSWAMFARVLESLELPWRNDIELVALLAQSIVGVAASAAFVDLLMGMKLVDPELLLARPDRWEALVADAPCERGKEMTRAWAALTAVAAAVLSNKLVNGKVTKERWLAAWEVHRQARLSKLAGGYVQGAAVAALAIPLATAALPAVKGLPTGPAYGLPFPAEATEATKLYTLATDAGGGGGAVEGRVKQA